MVEAIVIVFGAFLFSGAFILIVSYLIDWYENRDRKSYFNKADFNTLPAAKEVSNSYNRSPKEQEKAWKAIIAEIKYASRRGKGMCQISSSVYRHIPLETLKTVLKSKGYKLEWNIDLYYAKGLLIEISWEDWEDE